MSADSHNVRIGKVQDELEGLVDQMGLSQVLGLLASVCGLKAEHLRETWQDKGGAKIWEQSMKDIERVADKRHIRMC